MAESTNTAIFRFTDLPVELIIEIVIWAQILWREAEFAAHAPYAGSDRYAIFRVPYRHQPERWPRCCNGVYYDTNHWFFNYARPSCLTLSIPPFLRSPAHCLSQTGRSLRKLLTNRNSAIWKLDNVLFKHVAERSGVQRSTVGDRSVVQYGTRTLVATNVCSCMMRTLPSLYHGLESVKLAMPLAAPDDSTSAIEELCLGSTSREGGLLRHFDIEVYLSDPEIANRIYMYPLRPVLCEGLQTSRCANSVPFLFSCELTSLYIYHSVPHNPNFLESFSDALQKCSSHLQHLTIDAGNARFRDLHHVALPELRYLRLVAHEDQGAIFLSSVSLPATIDLHLEAVVEWRIKVSVTPASEGEITVPFSTWAREDAVSGRPSLWRYASVLAAPDQTRAIFQNPPVIGSSSASLWSSLETAALDIWVDHSMGGIEVRNTMRFPEHVSIAFAGSVTEMRAMLGDPGRGANHALPPRGKTTALRSLSVRDRELLALYRRVYDHLPIALYETVSHVATTALTPDKHSTGHPGVRQLVFSERTWMPRFALGWSHVLGPFNAVIELIFLCPVRTVGFIAFDDRLDLSHVDSLAIYLNEPGAGHVYPALNLETIMVRLSIAAANDPAWDVRELELLFNTPERLAAGAARLGVVVEEYQESPKPGVEYQESLYSSDAYEPVFDTSDDSSDDWEHEAEDSQESSEVI